MPPKQTRSKKGTASTSSGDDTTAAAAAPAPAPPPAPAPSSALSQSATDNSGTSVSSDTSLSWSVITAGSPHSRRDPTLSTLALGTTTTTTTERPTDTGNNIVPGTSTTPTDSSPSVVDGGDAISTAGGASTSDPPPSLDRLFAELDILRNQATNFQTQLDQHRSIMATSVSSIQSELQTLRDASSSQYTMTNQAMDLAKQSYDKVLECKSATSNLTLQFHNVTTKVDRFIKKYQAPPAPDPLLPASDSDHGSLEDAFQAADAALSEGLSTMEKEIGSRLDRNINVRLESSSGDTSHQPADVRFQGVTYRPSSTLPYDSDAAYAAAHPESALQASDATSPDSARSTTAERSTGGGTGGDGGSTATFGDGLSPRYNGPTSPRHRNALMSGCSPDILLWHAGGSLGDPVCGCPFMEAEDVEALDISSSLAVGIAEDHLGIVEGWENPRWSLQMASGPHST